MSGSRVHLSVENGSVVLCAEANGTDAVIFGDAVSTVNNSGAFFGEPTFSKGHNYRNVDVSGVVIGHGGKHVTELPQSSVTSHLVSTTTQQGVGGRTS
jgi:hypothetical protein